MSEPKPLASLSAGLLARKGAARPAMRRQTALPMPGTNGFIGHDDLGWNDMGYDVDPHHSPSDTARSGGHGLSPMPTPADLDPAAFDALGAAVDAANIAPIVPEADVPDSAEPPVVHRHMRRLEDELSPLVARSAPEPVSPEPVAFVPVAPLPDEQPAGQDAADAAPVIADVVPPVPTPVRKPRGRARPGARGAFAFTLRLDPDRHLRLRLASAAGNRSLQQILIALVDDFLAEQPEIDAFAAALPSGGRKH